MGEKFLKGPIPWPWLDKAGRLPGKALHLSLVLWHLVGCVNNRTVRVNLSRHKDLGLSVRTARRALRNLEQASLVATTQRSGQASEVTLLDLGDAKSLSDTASTFIGHPPQEAVSVRSQPL